MQRQIKKSKSLGQVGKRIQRSLTEVQRETIMAQIKKAEKMSSVEAHLNVDPISDKEQAFHKHVPNTVFGPAAQSSGRQEKGERDGGLVPAGNVAQFCRPVHPVTPLFPMLMGSKRILEKNPSRLFSVTRLAQRAQHLLLPPLQQTVPPCPPGLHHQGLARGRHTLCVVTAL